jgi:putative tricarboxylic transport membrane protein
VTLQIRNPKDFWAGILYVAIGVGALWVGQDYKMGTATRMGSGYFPAVISGLLVLLGVASTVRSFFRPGEPVGRLAGKPLALIVAGMILFGLLARGAGLIVALPLLALVSGYASQRFRVVQTLAITAVLSAFCILVFVVGLGIPLPLFGRWFGG